MASSYLLVNGLRCHYLRWEADQVAPYPPVVLLHDLADNARLWELVAPTLVASGLTVLAPDLRGHGLTDKPDDPYTFEVLRRDLAAFLDTAGLEHPLLVGFGLGADLALDYAAHLSFGPRAPAGVVLVDGGLLPLDSLGLSWEDTLRWLSPPSRQGMRLSHFISQLQSDLSPSAPALLDEVIPLLLASFELLEPEPGTNGASAPEETLQPHLAAEHQAQLLRAQWEFRPDAIIPRLRCPVIVASSPASLPHSLPSPSHPSSSLVDWPQVKQQCLARAQNTLPGLQVHWFPEPLPHIPLQRPGELANLIIQFAKTAKI